MHAPGVSCSLYGWVKSTFWGFSERTGSLKWFLPLQAQFRPAVGRKVWRLLSEYLHRVLSLVAVPTAFLPSPHVLPITPIIHERFWSWHLLKILQHQTGGVLTQDAAVGSGHPGPGWRCRRVGGSWSGRGHLLVRCGPGLRREHGWLMDFLFVLLRHWSCIWGSWPQDVIEAGETDVKTQAKLCKELFIERVELLWDVIAQQGREDAGDVAFFGQKKVETFPGPGNVATCGLGSQSNLRGVRSREWRL